LRSLARSCLLALLTSGMLNTPGAYAAANPIGIIVTAANAHLGGENAVTGSNVFPGDYLETDSTGTLRFKSGGSQFYLGASSSMVLLGQERTVDAKLVRGTLTFNLTGHSIEAAQFQVETPVGIIRAANPKGAFGEVTVLSSEKIVVAAYRGDLMVTGSGMERMIKEGDAFTVTLVPDPQGPAGAGTGNHSDTQRDSSGNQNPNPGGNQGGGNGGHFGINSGALRFDAILIGIFAGAGAAAWVLSSESDSQPQPH
jgi:hypothetical protein